MEIGQEQSEGELRSPRIGRELRSPRIGCELRSPRIGCELQPLPSEDKSAECDLQLPQATHFLVGVLADTHSRMPSALYAALADCDHIIHAGDIGNPDILRGLRTLAPVTAVLGNNDFNEYGKDVGRFAKPVLGGVRFFVTHYPQHTDVTGAGRKFFKPGEPLPHVCIHGHTHIPRLITGKEAGAAHAILCPGSAAFPRGGLRPGIAKIALEDGRFKEAYFETL